MYNAIWEPAHDVKERICVRREDVAEVCTVEDIFEGRQYADPYRWSPITGYVTASIEEDQPGHYWRNWEGELSRDRQYEGSEE